MVRETRYLLVGNLPENTTVDEVTDYFKRYGKIQKVIINTTKSEVKDDKDSKEKDENKSTTATVAFTDIKSASNAHKAEKQIGNNLLTSEYSEGFATTGSIVTRTHEPEIYPRPPPGGYPKGPKGFEEEVDGFDVYYGTTPQYEGPYPTPPAPFSEENRPQNFPNRGRPRERTWIPGVNFHGRGAKWAGGTMRIYADSVSKDVAPVPAASPTHSVAPSTSSKRSKKKKRKKSKSVSRSGSRSSSASSRSSSSASSRSASSSTERPKTVASTAQKVVQEPVIDNEIEPGERESLGIYITKLPIRSSDTSLRDGLFHEYKKYGKVTAVQVCGVADGRYAIVSFKQGEDAAKALTASQGKRFFGTLIEVQQHEGIEVDDTDLKPPEADLDEHHPKSTRTLFIGNLEKDITIDELKEKLKTYGEIIDVDVKRQGAVSAYAFIQFSDISSVVRALRDLEGTAFGSNKIKLGFGKSMATSCIWLDNLADTVSEGFLCRQFSRFGGISHAVVDRAKRRGLVFFLNIESAQFALPEMRNRIWNGKKIHIDFASRDCQESFFQKMEASGQLQPGERPDPRWMNKQLQNDPYWDESMDKEFAASGTPHPNAVNRRGAFTPFRRGRGRFQRGWGAFRGRGGPFEHGSFNNEEFPGRRKQFDEYSQGSGQYPEDDSYEQELREYGHSQRERRERSTSPHGYDEAYYETGSQSGRDYVLYEKHRYEHYRSPSSERELDLDDEYKYKSRTSDERYYYKDKYYEIETKSRERSLSSDSEQRYRVASEIVRTNSRSRSPSLKHKRTKELPISYRSQSPPTPTDDEPLYYSNSRDPSPTDFDSAFRKYGDYNKRLSGGLESDKIGKSSVLTLATGLRKEIESVKAEDKLSRKRSYDQMSPKKMERQHSRGSRSGSLYDYDRSEKLTAKELLMKVARLKSEVYERTTGKSSPSSGSSYGDIDPSSLSESELAKLHHEKQKLLEKLGQMDENGSTSDTESNGDMRHVINKKARLEHGKYFQKSESLNLTKHELKEKLKLLDSTQSCRKQMESLRKKEQEKELLRNLKKTKSAGDVKRDLFDYSDTEENLGLNSPKEIPSGFLPKKRRKLEGETDRKGRSYRIRRDDEEGAYSSDEEKSDLLQRQISSHSDLFERTRSISGGMDLRLENDSIYSSSNVHSHGKDETRRISSGSESNKEHSEHRRRRKQKNNHVTPLIPLGEDDDMPDPEVSDPRVPKEKRDSPLILPLPKFAQYIHFSPPPSPVHVSPKTSYSDLSKTERTPPRHNESQSLQGTAPLPLPPLATDAEDQSPCFSPQSSSSKTHSPSQSPSGSASDNSKGNSEENAESFPSNETITPDTVLDENKPDSLDSVPNLERDLESKEDGNSSDSNSDQENLSSDNLSIEERIRQLDEKLGKAQQAVTPKTIPEVDSVVNYSSASNNVSLLTAVTTAASSSPSLTSIYSKFKIRKKNETATETNDKGEPSEIVRTVLSKTSIFDQDSKRLEQIHDKYDENETNINADESSPNISSVRAKSETNEMPLITLPGSLMERLGQNTTFPTLTVNTSLSNQMSGGSPNSLVNKSFEDNLVNKSFEESFVNKSFEDSFVNKSFESSMELSLPEHLTPKTSPSINMVNNSANLTPPLTPMIKVEGSVTPKSLVESDSQPPLLETPVKSDFSVTSFKVESEITESESATKAPELERQCDTKLSEKVTEKIELVNSFENDENGDVNATDNKTIVKTVNEKEALDNESDNIPVTPKKEECSDNVDHVDSEIKEKVENKTDKKSHTHNSVKDSNVTVKAETVNAVVKKENIKKEKKDSDGNNIKDISSRSAFDVDIFGMSSPLQIGKRKVEDLKSETDKKNSTKSNSDSKAEKSSSVSQHKTDTKHDSASKQKEKEKDSDSSQKPKSSSEKDKSKPDKDKTKEKSHSSVEPNSKKQKLSKDKKSDSSQREDKHKKKESDKKSDSHKSSSDRKDKHKVKSDKDKKDSDKKSKEDKDKKQKDEKKKKDVEKKDDKKEKHESEKKDKEESEKKDKSDDKKDKINDKKDKTDDKKDKSDDKKDKSDEKKDKTDEKKDKPDKIDDKKDKINEKKEKTDDHRKSEKSKSSSSKKDKKDSHKHDRHSDKHGLKSPDKKQSKSSSTEHKDKDNSKETEKLEKDSKSEKKTEHTHKKEHKSSSSHKVKKSKETKDEASDLNKTKEAKESMSESKSRTEPSVNDTKDPIEDLKETTDKTEQHEEKNKEKEPSGDRCKDSKSHEKERENKDRDPDPSKSKGKSSTSTSSSGEKAKSATDNKTSKSKSDKASNEEKKSESKKDDKKKDSSSKSGTNSSISSKSSKDKDKEKIKSDSQSKSATKSEKSSSKSSSKSNSDNSSKKEDKTSKDNSKEHSKDKENKESKDKDTPKKKPDHKEHRLTELEKLDVNLASFYIEPYVSMYDKVKRRSTDKKDKEKESEDLRKQISAYKKKQKKKKKFSLSDVTESSEFSTDEDTKNKRENKKKFGLSFVDTDSSSDDEILRNPKKTKGQMKKPKRILDIYSSDSEEEESMISPGKKSISNAKNKKGDSFNFDSDSLSDSDHKNSATKPAKSKTVAKTKKSEKSNKSKPAAKSKNKPKMPRKNLSLKDLFSDDSDDSHLSDSDSDSDIMIKPKLKKKPEPKTPDSKKTLPKGSSIYTTSEDSESENERKPILSPVKKSPPKKTFDKKGESDTFTSDPEFFDNNRPKKQVKKNAKFDKKHSDSFESDNFFSDPEFTKPKNKTKDILKVEDFQPEVKDVTVLSAPETVLKLDKGKEKVKKQKSKDKSSKESKKNKKNKKNNEILSDNESSLAKNMSKLDVTEVYSETVFEKDEPTESGKKSEQMPILSCAEEESVTKDDSSKLEQDIVKLALDDNHKIPKADKVKSKKHKKEKKKKKEKEREKTGSATNLPVLMSDGDEHFSDSKNDLSHTQEVKHDADLGGDANSSGNSTRNLFDELRADMSSDDKETKKHKKKREKAEMKEEKVEAKVDMMSEEQVSDIEIKHKSDNESFKTERHTEVEKEPETAVSDAFKETVEPVNTEEKTSQGNDVFEFTEEEEAEKSLTPFKESHVKIMKPSAYPELKLDAEDDKDVDTSEIPIEIEGVEIEYQTQEQDYKDESEDVCPEVETSEVIIETNIVEEKAVANKPKQKAKKRRGRRNSAKDTKIELADVDSNIFGVACNREESSKTDVTVEAISSLENTQKAAEELQTEVVSFDPPTSNEQELIIDEGVSIQVQDETATAVDSIVESRNDVDETAAAVESILLGNEIPGFGISDPTQPTPQQLEEAYLGNLNQPEPIPQLQTVEVEATTQPDKTTPGKTKGRRGRRSKSTQNEISHESELLIMETIESVSHGDDMSAKTQTEPSENKAYDGGPLNPYLADVTNQHNQNDDDDDDGRLQIVLDPPKPEPQRKPRKPKQTKGRKMADAAALAAENKMDNIFDSHPGLQYPSDTDTENKDVSDMNRDSVSENELEHSKNEDLLFMDREDQRHDSDLLSPDERSNEDMAAADIIKRPKRGRKPKNYKELNSGPKPNSPRGSRTVSPRSPRSNDPRSPKYEPPSPLVKSNENKGRRGKGILEDGDMKEFLNEETGEIRLSSIENIKNKLTFGEGTKNAQKLSNVFDFDDEETTTMKQQRQRKKKGELIMSPENRGIFSSPEHGGPMSGSEEKLSIGSPQPKMPFSSPEHKVNFHSPDRKNFSLEKKLEIDLKAGLFSPVGPMENQKTEVKAVMEEKDPEPLFKAFFEAKSKSGKQENEKISPNRKLSAPHIDLKELKIDTSKQDIMHDLDKSKGLMSPPDKTKVLMSPPAVRSMTNVDKTIDNVSKGLFEGSTDDESGTGEGGTSLGQKKKTSRRSRDEKKEQKNMVTGVLPPLPAVSTQGAIGEPPVVGHAGLLGSPLSSPLHVSTTQPPLTSPRHVLSAEDKTATPNEIIVPSEMTPELSDSLLSPLKMSTPTVTESTSVTVSGPGITTSSEATVKPEQSKAEVSTEDVLKNVMPSFLVPGISGSSALNVVQNVTSVSGIEAQVAAGASIPANAEKSAPVNAGDAFSISKGTGAPISVDIVSPNSTGSSIQTSAAIGAPANSGIDALSNSGIDALSNSGIGVTANSGIDAPTSEVQKSQQELLEKQRLEQQKLLQKQQSQEQMLKRQQEVQIRLQEQEHQKQLLQKLQERHKQLQEQQKLQEKEKEEVARQKQLEEHHKQLQQQFEHLQRQQTLQVQPGVTGNQGAPPPPMLSPGAIRPQRPGLTSPGANPAGPRPPISAHHQMPQGAPFGLPGQHAGVLPIHAAHMSPGQLPLPMIPQGLGPDKQPTSAAQQIQQQMLTQAQKAQQAQLQKVQAQYLAEQQAQMAKQQAQAQLKQQAQQNQVNGPMGKQGPGTQPLAGPISAAPPTPGKKGQELGGNKPGSQTGRKEATPQRPAGPHLPGPPLPQGKEAPRPGSQEAANQLQQQIRQQLARSQNHPGGHPPGHPQHPAHSWPMHPGRPEGQPKDEPRPSVSEARTSMPGPIPVVGGNPQSVQRVSPHPPTKSPTVAQTAPNMVLGVTPHQASAPRAPSPAVAKTAERPPNGKWSSTSPGAQRPGQSDIRPRVPHSEPSSVSSRPELWGIHGPAGQPPQGMSITPRPAHQQPPSAHQQQPEHPLPLQRPPAPEQMGARDKFMHQQREKQLQELQILHHQELQRQELRQQQLRDQAQKEVQKERERAQELERDGRVSQSPSDPRQSPAGVLPHRYPPFVEPRPPSREGKMQQSPAIMDPRFSQYPPGHHPADLRINSSQAPSAFSPAAPGSTDTPHMYSPAEIQRLQQNGIIPGYPGLRMLEPHMVPGHAPYMLPGSVHPLAYIAQQMDHQHLVDGRPQSRECGRPPSTSSAHNVSPTLAAPPDSRLPSRSQNGPQSRPGSDGPHPGDGSLLSLLQRYPVMWQGILGLKNDNCVVQMHFIAGCRPLVKLSLPQQGPDGTVQPLRIAQRMRLEQAQLDGVAKRMQFEKDYCMMLALPCGRDHTDIYQQTRAMSTGFIQYLQQKQAAGIVNVADPGSQQPAYVVHIFPPCEFSNSTLSRLGFDLLYQVKDLAHLIVIIATVA